MIRAEKLTKRYGRVTAVDKLTFSCGVGEVVGFLGPNGAGKTSTLRMLAGYTPPTSGAAYIAGHHTVDQSLQARQKLGYLPETVPLYSEMQVDDYLAFMGNLRRVPNVWRRVDEVLTAVDMLGRAESRIGSLSKGMRQRVGLAQALLHNPPVLILDEPTIGLDPRQVADVRDLIAQLGEQHTILLSTHILSEVDQICSRVMMLFNGRVVADEPLANLADGENQLRLVVAHPTAETETLLAALEGIRQVQRVAGREFALAYDGQDKTRQSVAETAVRFGLLELAPQKRDLETLFLAQMRRAEARGGA